MKKGAALAAVLRGQCHGMTVAWRAVEETFPATSENAYTLLYICYQYGPAGSLLLYHIGSHRPNWDAAWRRAFECIIFTRLSWHF